MKPSLLCLVALLLAEVLAAQTPLDTLWTIGTFDGPDELVFASIVDAEIMEDGSILVLDDQLRELRRYGADGRYLGTVGGGGQGPGEFIAPVDVENPLARQSLAEGYVACAPEAGVVLLAFVSHPVVQEFSTGGALLWTDTLPDFVPIQVTYRQGGRSVGFGVDPERGLDLTVSTFGPGDGRTFMLQVGHRAPGSKRGEDYTFVRSWVYDAATGVRTALSDRLPLLRSVARDRAVAVASLPFPTVSVLRRPRAPGLR